MAIPERPKIYHITHIQNLANIIEQGVIWSDAKRIELGIDCELVGMSSIKKRRLEKLIVKCHPPTKVGEYVPFYFCPRSIMLYLIYMANHPELAYRGGQGPILHLVADVQDVVAWAETNGRRWAFSASNAGAGYTNFFSRLDQLVNVNWDAVEATDFRDADVKEGKQAEFLLHESFPWSLVESIGVHDAAVARAVIQQLDGLSHQPPIAIQRGWYY
jgi:hypothetical protein